MTTLFPLPVSNSVSGNNLPESSYLPFYRKYRPQSLQQLVGQQAIVQTLTNAIINNRLTHAYLFCGPRGTGKTSSARILAKSLNCVQGSTPTPCQVCPSCVSITQGNALDVCEIDAASNNGVDQIRELTERVQFKALEGHYRIYIIDEVHMLTTAAFNALLKTLEEPPANVIFIFATTEPHKVLPTILSRCQRFDFSRITRLDIETQLQSIAQQENIPIAPEAITFIARHAKGGMRDALSLLDQVSLFGKDNQAVSVEQVRLVTGGVTEESLFELILQIAQQNPINLITLLKAQADHGIEPGLLAKELLTGFKNVLLVQATVQQAISVPDIATMLDVSEETVLQLQQMAQHFPVEMLPQIVHRLAQLELQLKTTANAQLWLEVTLLGLCVRDQLHTLSSLESRIEQLENQLQQGVPAKPLPKQTAPPATVLPKASPSPPLPAPDTVHQAAPQPTAGIPAPSAPPLAPSAAHFAFDSSLAKQFQDILLQLEQVSIRSLLEQQAHLVEVTDTMLVLGFKTEAILAVFNTPPKIKAFEQAVQKVYQSGRTIQLVVDASLAQPAAAPQTAAAPPLPAVLPEPQVASSTAPPLAATQDFDLQDAKRYTQELLGARVIDTP